MSLRPVASVVPPAPKRSSSSRLESVLRAGQTTALVTNVYDQGEEDADSGLTKALKNASLVPTGVCLPRGFDPDYCAYDRYYAVGVALVSAVLGALVDADVPRRLLIFLTSRVKEQLGNLCYTPPTDMYSQLMGNDKSFDKLSPHDQDKARTEFSGLCQRLDQANEQAYNLGLTDFEHVRFLKEEAGREYDRKDEDRIQKLKDQESWIDWLVGLDDLYKDELFVLKRIRAENEAVARAKDADPVFRFELLSKELIRLIMLPGSMLGSFIMPSNTYKKSDDDPSQNAEKWMEGVLPSPMYEYPVQERMRRLNELYSHPNWLYVGAMAAWTLKHVSRYMNEHALMVASFFRTNARRLSAGQAPMLDLVAFARQCREDIADGANPPPPPPPAYEDFNPAAVEAERRREDARKRAEERDPLMPGVDYPPPIDASAAGKRA